MYCYKICEFDLSKLEEAEKEINDLASNGYRVVNFYYYESKARYTLEGVRQAYG